MIIQKLRFYLFCLVTVFFIITGEHGAKGISVKNCWEFVLVGLVLIAFGQFRI